MCWVYDDDVTFDVAVHDFFADGLARGEQLLCVGERVIESLRTGAAPLPDVDRLVAGERLALMTTAEAYTAAGGFAPERQLEFYEAATNAARAAGFTGLRVIADVSPLGADPAQLPELVRWEHLADSFIAGGGGLSAMCVYRHDLAPELLAETALRHPVVEAPAGLPPFRIFFDEDRLVLAGSIDTFGAARLSRVLASSPVTGTVVTLDLRRVEFIDVAGCRALAAWAGELRQRSVALHLLGASRLLRRMWELLALADVAPVTFLEQAA